MLKGHMQLDLWRENDKLLITDGEQTFELALAVPPELEFRH